MSCVSRPIGLEVDHTYGQVCASSICAEAGPSRDMPMLMAVVVISEQGGRGGKAVKDDGICGFVPLVTSKVCLEKCLQYQAAMAGFVSLKLSHLD
jgi:hypothetical protein